MNDAIKIADNAVLLQIADDGVGFDTVILQCKKSFGIFGAHKLVNILSGTFTLQADIGKGTHLIVRIQF